MIYSWLQFNVTCEIGEQIIGKKRWVFTTPLFQLRTNQLSIFNVNILKHTVVHLYLYLYIFLGLQNIVLS